MWNFLKQFLFKLQFIEQYLKNLNSIYDFFLVICIRSQIIVEQIYRKIHIFGKSGWYENHFLDMEYLVCNLNQFLHIESIIFTYILAIYVHFS